MMKKLPILLFATFHFLICFGKEYKVESYVIRNRDKSKYMYLSISYKDSMGTTYHVTSGTVVFNSNKSVSKVRNLKKSACLNKAYKNDYFVTSDFESTCLYELIIQNEIYPLYLIEKQKQLSK